MIWVDGGMYIWFVNHIQRRPMETKTVHNSFRLLFLIQVDVVCRDKARSPLFDLEARVTGVTELARVGFPG